VGPLDAELRRRTAAIVARYSDRPADGQVIVEARHGRDGTTESITTGASEPRPLRCCRALRSSRREGTRRCGAQALRSSAGGGALGRRIGRPCPRNTSRPAAPELSLLAGGIYPGAEAGGRVLGQCVGRFVVPARPGSETGQPWPC